MKSFKFKAEDETEITFEMVEEILDCQRFRIHIDGQKDRSITLYGSDTEAHYKTLEILCAGGICHFNQLGLWEGSIEQLTRNTISS